MNVGALSFGFALALPAWSALGFEEQTRVDLSAGMNVFALALRAWRAIGLESGRGLICRLA